MSPVQFRKCVFDILVLLLLRAVGVSAATALY